MDLSHIIILFGISFSRIVMEQPKMIFRTRYLGLSEAENECRNSGFHLIDFLSIKDSIDNISSKMVLNKQYWVADNWISKIFFVKGCKSNVKIKSTRIFQENLFSECVSYCQKQTFTTIGLQGSNCSCIVDDNPQNIGSNDCDLECAWNNNLCRAEKYLVSVYQLAKDLPFSLGGKVLDDCVYFQIYNYEKYFNRGDCKEKNGFICQHGRKYFIVHEKLSTWIEANLECSKENMTLANLNEKDPKNPGLSGNKRYWIGIRQSYMQLTEVKSTDCLTFEKYNSKGDISFLHQNCSKENRYICIQDPVSMTSTTIIQRDEKIQTTSKIYTHNVQTANGGDTNNQTGFKSGTAMHAQERENYRNESGSGVIPGVIVGIIGTVALVMLIVICLYFRFRNTNPRSKYQSPTVTFSSAPRRDSKLSQDRSVKSTPLKPVRRSKKSNPGSLTGGTAYENIVLTLEDPATISRVVSSSSTAQKQDMKDVENSYDVMGAFNTNNNQEGTTQSVYGFSAPDNDYDVMDRGTRRTDEVNPDYDHM